MKKGLLMGSLLVLMIIAFFSISFTSSNKKSGQIANFPVSQEYCFETQGDRTINATYMNFSLGISGASNVSWDYHTGYSYGTPWCFRVTYTPGNPQ